MPIGLNEGNNFFFFLFLSFLLFRLSFLGQITIRIDTLWVQPLEFSTDNFETIHTCSTWSVYVHVVWELPSRYIYQRFLFFFSTQLFPGSISIKAQLIEVFTDHFETMYTSST